MGGWVCLWEVGKERGTPPYNTINGLAPPHPNHSSHQPTIQPIKRIQLSTRQADGALVLYRGNSPLNHKGPVWSSQGALVFPGRANRGGKAKGGEVTVAVDQRKVLKVLRQSKAAVAGNKRAHTPKPEVLFAKALSQLPREMHGLGLFAS